MHKTLEYDPEIGSILISQKRFLDKFVQHILCIIFHEKYFSSYILLTGQNSLSYYLYFSRYWTIYVLQLFVNQTVTS